MIGSNGVVNDLIYEDLFKSFYLEHRPVEECGSPNSSARSLYPVPCGPLTYQNKTKNKSRMDKQGWRELASLRNMGAIYFCVERGRLWLE